MTIYLDNAATTRVAAQVADLVVSCMSEEYGNPASAHHMGIAAERRVKAAREAILAAIGDPGGRLGDLYFTSGGTESDAIGVIGAARARRRRGAHILYSAIEHPAVRASADALASEGFRADAIAVTADGVIEVERAVDALADDTVVVAAMLVNNEIGTIAPIGALCRAIAERRPEAHVHCDAVQALGKMPIDVGALGAGSVAFAAHKLHGPKGVGALWVAKGARLEALWAGGGQQGGLRSGTLNVPGIAGMGAAVQLAYEADGGGGDADAMDAMDARVARWRGFADVLIEAARSSGVETKVNGAGAPRAAHIVSMAFRGVPAEPLLHVMESRGVLVSAGSACAERSKKPSPVLSAIGVAKEWGTLRFSFGRDTTAAEVGRAAEILVSAVGDFR